MKVEYDDSLYGAFDDVETPETLAFEHALDISFDICDRMKEMGVSQRDLAARMEITESRVSQLLNMQPNMTLETLAKFELALGFRFGFEIKDDYISGGSQETALEISNRALGIDLLRNATAVELADTHVDGMLSKYHEVCMSTYGQRIEDCLLAANADASQHSVANDYKGLGKVAA